MHYFNHTPAGKPHPRILGGFETADAANASRDALVADFPGDDVGEVYESATDPRDAEPRPFQVTHQAGTDVEVWTDGTVTPVE
jgi:hypothetical protein